jgi:putative membrane protein
MTIADLPGLNASLNSIATIFLLMGFIFARTHRVKAHKLSMVGALVISAAFLTSYLIYHFNVEIITKYQGAGLWRIIYYSILFSHIPLAVLMVPFIIRAVFLAIKGRIEEHRAMVRWVWPVWMYVSVTGVLIYLMLY